MSVVDQYRRLFEANVKGSLEFYKRMSTLTREALDSRQLREGGSRSLSGVASTLVQLNLRWYEELTRHGLSYLDRAAQTAERTLGRKSEGRLEVEVSAGDVVSAPFYVSNSQADAADVACTAAPLTSGAGQVIAADRLRVEPPRLVLQPGQKELFRLCFTVDGEFVPGESYSTRILIGSVPPREVPVTVRVRAAKA